METFSKGVGQQEVIKTEDTDEAISMEETDFEREAVSVDEIDVEHASSNTVLVEPKVGMEFQSFEEVNAFYTQYADLMGFGVKIKNSKHEAYDDDLKLVRRATLACSRSGKKPVNSTNAFVAKRLTSRTDCKAQLGLKFYVGKYVIINFVSEHNHELLSQDLMRFLPSKRQAFKEYLNNELNNAFSIGIERTNTTSMVESGGLSLQKQSTRELLNRIRSLKFGLGDADALQQYFLQMQLKDHNFFYLVDMDEPGLLKNVFWADSISRDAYKYFDDVVTFHSTYITGNYNLPLVSFLGVNHHGQTILLGCGLLCEGSTENYAWLFRTWLACMSGKAPDAIIIDHVRPILHAIKVVFPKSRYRLCHKNIMQSLSHELGSDEYINDCIKHVVYDSLTIKEFEENWKSMLQNNGLQDNHSLHKMYELRNMWAPAFIKGMLWPDMATIQWSESPGSFFDHHVNTRTTLKQFIEQYEMILQLKYDKTANADFASCHRKVPLKTSFYMEEQIAQIYTIGIFRKFQEELFGMMYCYPSVVGTDGCSFAYMVIEHVPVKLDNGTSKLLEKKYSVFFKDKDMTLSCICGSHEFRGILCRHALTVLRYRDLDKIPHQYIVDRWRKGLDHTRAGRETKLQPVGQDSNSPSERYEDVYLICIRLAEIASLSHEKYSQIMEIISDSLKGISSDSTTEKS